jgi:hypothetical protein
LLVLHHEAGTIANAKLLAREWRIPESRTVPSHDNIVSFSSRALNQGSADQSRM